MKSWKLLVLVLAVALLVSVAGGAFADEKVVKMIIPELCASNFTQATAVFDGFKGVASYEVDVENTSAVLTMSDGGADIKGIMEALKNLAMPVTETEELRHNYKFRCLFWSFVSINLCLRSRFNPRCNVTNSFK